MFSKYYFEKYAQLTLSSMNNFVGRFNLSDKPDLQDIKNSIGIEVVNVEKEEEGTFRYLWNKYSGKGISSDEFKSKLQKTEFQQKVITGLPFMAAEIRTGEARECIEEVIQMIQIIINGFLLKIFLEGHLRLQHYNQRNGTKLLYHLLLLMLIVIPHLKKL